MGGSLGLAYHLLVDGIALPGPYHGLPFALQIETHRAIFVAIGTAEAVDVMHKPPSHWDRVKISPTAPAHVPDDIRKAHEQLRRQRLQLGPAIRRALKLRDTELLTRYGV